LLKYPNEIALKRRRGVAEVTYPGHLRSLLCARRERPRCRPTEQRDELAPFQLIELHYVPASAELHDHRIGQD
jgi:hypothetical protein